MDEESKDLITEACKNFS